MFIWRKIVEGSVNQKTIFLDDDQMEEGFVLLRSITESFTLLTEQEENIL